MKSLISGKDAAYVARESLKRRPIKLLPPEGVEDTSAAPVPSDAAEQARKAPPRVLKPSALNDQCVAPTPDLESHRKRLREARRPAPELECLFGALGQIREGGVPVQSYTLWRALLATPAERIYRTFHAERNHQGKGNVLLFPRDTNIHRAGPVQCRERLGGLLRYYHQEAA